MLLVLTLLIAGEVPEPDAAQVWSSVKAKYATAEFYRDEVTTGALHFRTAFNRKYGIRMEGSERVGMSWVTFGKPPCIRLYHRNAWALHDCSPDRPLPAIGDTQAPQTVIPALLMPELKAIRVDHWTPAKFAFDGLVMLEFQNNGFRDVYRYYIDSSSYTVLRFEHAQIASDDPYKELAVRDVEFKNVSFTSPVSRFEATFLVPPYVAVRNHPRVAVLLLWLLIGAAHYLLTARTLRHNGLSPDWRQERRKSWLRFAKVTGIVITLLALLFGLALLIPGGHPRAVIIPILLAYPVFFLIVTVGVSLAGRDLAIQIRARRTLAT